MAYLGFATGLRPSSMRPLRRKGPTPDVRWDESVVLVRRSHTLGHEIMDTTKTKLRQRISVPSEVMEVLRWHVQTQLATPEQVESDLLFSAADGGFLNEHCLRQPFAKVGSLIGLPMKLTPRGMRRTFNDLARVANVETLVTKSISGHLTDRMREHLLDGPPRRAAREHRPPPASREGRSTHRHGYREHQWCSWWCSDLSRGAPEAGGDPLTPRIICRRDRFRT
jgi:hypothetical protein